MKKVMVAAVFAVALSILAATAWGSANAPARAKASSRAAAATVTCGSTRTIGIAAPYTGPAADIGLDGVGEARVPARQRRIDRRPFWLQPGGVAGQVDHGGDQGGQVRRLQCAVELSIVGHGRFPHTYR